MEVVCAQALEKDQIRNAISDIFVEGFYEWIKFFSKDKNKLKKAFAHMFILDAFQVAVINGQIAGFASVYNDQIQNISLTKKTLQTHLGFVMGTIAYRILRREFENKEYPFEITADMQIIEFAATHPKYRRMGVASQVIKHILKDEAYASFVLEVADTNTNAVSLYEKLGFREFARVKMKDSRRSGINFLVYMKYERTAPDKKEI